MISALTKSVRSISSRASGDTAAVRSCSAAAASSADLLSHPTGLSSTTRVQPPSPPDWIRRGARSRLSRSIRSYQRSCGSSTWESAEIFDEVAASTCCSCGSRRRGPDAVGKHFKFPVWHSENPYAASSTERACDRRRAISGGCDRRVRAAARRLLAERGTGGAAERVSELLRAATSQRFAGTETAESILHRVALLGRREERVPHVLRVGVLADLGDLAFAQHEHEAVVVVVRLAVPPGELRVELHDDDVALGDHEVDVRVVAVAGFVPLVERLVEVGETLQRRAALERMPTFEQELHRTRADPTEVVGDHRDRRVGAHAVGEELPDDRLVLFCGRHG